jgi:nicotinate-nucleotide adenylyltransferase
MSTINSAKVDILLLMGGTFDPIHLGHILPAEETARWLGAAQVALIPAHIPPHKSTPHASAEQRATMAELVCNNQPLFYLDKRELQRNSHSFTIDTLVELKAEQPNKRLHFIMGMDSLLTFTRWERWQKILTLCHLVVNIRPGYSHQQLENSLSPELHAHIVDNITELERHSVGKIILHDCTAADVSSTEIRNSIKKGKNYSPFVSQAVHEYIEQQQLYR